MLPDTLRSMPPTVLPILPAPPSVPPMPPPRVPPIPPPSPPPPSSWAEAGAAKAIEALAPIRRARVERRIFRLLRQKRGALDATLISTTTADADFIHCSTKQFASNWFKEVYFCNFRRRDPVHRSGDRKSTRLNSSH